MTVLPSLPLLNKINQFIQEWGGRFSLNYSLFLLSWKSGLRVSEAVNFDYHLKHPRHKNLYLVKGKGNKTRYVYVSKEVIQELKSNHWKPNQTNRFTFNNFLKNVKARMNIPASVELAPHTLRRCFTTHNALNGVPIPILQKALGHKNIRTTSFYWKGSVDIREFGEWLEPNSDPRGPEEVPKVKVDNIPQLPKSPKIPLKIESSSPNKEPELLKTIAKLKGELEQKDLIIAEKNKQLKDKDSKISLLVSENQKLKAINQEKDRKLKELQEKVKQLTIKNNSLIENSANLKNSVKNTGEIKGNNNLPAEKPQQLEISPKNNNLLLNSEIKKPPNNSLVIKEKEQGELIAEIQVWKPLN